MSMLYVCRTARALNEGEPIIYEFESKRLPYCPYTIMTTTYNLQVTKLQAFDENAQLNANV